MVRPLVLLHTDAPSPEHCLDVLHASRDFVTFVHTGTPEDTLDFVRRIRCDAIVLEVAAENGATCGLIDALCHAGYHGRILAVLPHVDEASSARLLDAGCAGVLPSKNPEGVLLGALRELLMQSTAGHNAPVSLSDRERTVLKFVWDGCSNKEIAARLSLSEGLVKATLQRLFAKTGVHTRSQLVRRTVEMPNWLASLLIGTVFCCGDLPALILSQLLVT